MHRPEFPLALRVLLFLSLWTAWAPGVLAQDIIGVSARYSDSFSEWIIITDKEYREGQLVQQWRGSDDWTQWDFRLGDTLADIRLKWREDPNLWEVRCLGEVVTARTLWRDNFLEWRLEDSRDRFVWYSRYANVRDEWIMRRSERGEFSVYTYWEGNPQDWVVVDALEPDVSYAMRVAMLFLAVFHSTPRL